MGLSDRFGLPLSTGSSEAAARYIAAVDLLLSANLGAEEQLESAVAADPDFALAHIAYARLLGSAPGCRRPRQRQQRRGRSGRG